MNPPDSVNPDTPPERPRGRGRSKSTLWRIVLGFALTAAIAFFLIKGCVQTNDILQNGLVTEGTPTGKSVSHSMNRDGHVDRVERLEFRYVVDGVTYKAEGRATYDREFFDLNKALAVNQSVEVRYLENDPSEAIVLDVDYRHD